MGIDIQTLITPMLAIWLPFVRILAFFLFCPLFDHNALPRRIKVSLAFVLSIIMTPMIGTNVVLNDLLTIQSVILIAEQILWGLVFGFLLQLVFVALQTAGHILSFNMGLGMAIMNDPNSGVSTTVLSQMVYLFTAMLFFAMDGHLLMVTILFKGFAYWPIGQAINELSLRTLVLGLSWVFSASVLLALPTTLIMLTVQGVFGMLNRVSPTLNLFALGFPISMLFGLFCLMLLASNIPDHYLNLTNMVLDQLDKLRISHG